MRKRSTRNRWRAREIVEMSTMLRRKGYAHPYLYARKLSREGIGPYELESLLRHRHGEVGSLGYTHGFKRVDVGGARWKQHDRSWRRGRRRRA